MCLWSQGMALCHFLCASHIAARAERQHFTACMNCSLGFAQTVTKDSAQLGNRVVVCSVWCVLVCNMLDCDSFSWWRTTLWSQTANRSDFCEGKLWSKLFPHPTAPSPPPPPLPSHCYFQPTMSWSEACHCPSSGDFSGGHALARLWAHWLILN